MDEPTPVSVWLELRHLNLLQERYPNLSWSAALREMIEEST